MMASSSTKASRSKASRKSASKSAPAMTEDQKAAHEAERHAPVSLPSGGSYDAADLQKGLDKVVDRQGANRTKEVGAALKASATEAPTTSSAAPNALPNHRLVEVETQLAAGVEVGTGKSKKVVGAETVTEYRQVFDEKNAGEASKSDVVGTATSGERSEVLKVDKVDAKDLSPEPPQVPATDGESGEPGTTTTPITGDADTAPQA